ncbi:MAG: hypothetical protein R3B13_18560 [Polyangiaceae bacterium]
MPLALLLSACGGPGSHAPASAPAAVAVPSQPASPGAADDQEDAAPPSPNRNARIAGEYRVEHEVSYNCDLPEWCTGPVTNSLTVKQERDDIVVEIQLVHTNMHTCTWQGTLSARAQDRYEFSEPDCDLSLTVTPTTLQLRSEGCREYCGARAYLEGDFPR